MKNKALFNVALCAALLSPLFSQAQSVGIGTTAPDASAALDVSATNKGLLIPRVTLANRPANPVAGLMIYQTDNTPGFYIYNNGSWGQVTTVGASGSVASALSLNSSIGSIAANGTAYVFAGTPATVTITSTNQKVIVNATAVLGLSTASTSNLSMGVVYRLSSSTIAPTYYQGNYIIVPMTTDRHPYTVHNVLTGLTPGIYSIGFGVYNNTTSAVNNNDWLSGTVTVIN
jgi:hypothetical protein